MLLIHVQFVCKSNLIFPCRSALLPALRAVFVQLGSAVQVCNLLFVSFFHTIPLFLKTTCYSCSFTPPTNYTHCFIIHAINKHIQTNILFSVQSSSQFWTQPVWALLCLQCCQALHSILDFFCSCPSPQILIFPKLGMLYELMPWWHIQQRMALASTYRSVSVLKTLVLHIYMCLHH